MKTKETAANQKTKMKEKENQTTKTKETAANKKTRTKEKANWKTKTKAKEKTKEKTIQIKSYITRKLRFSKYPSIEKNF
jgi:hypothetical protein